MRFTRYLVTPRFAWLSGWALLTALACNQRFEFDIPGRAGSGGMLATGGAASAGAAGSIVGGAASAGSAGQSGAGAAAGCGVHPQCPAPLHCEDQECWQCAEDSHCADYDLERCDFERHRCVGCLTTLDCADGFV
ncbi:MAG TPA: hypothetical protein VEX18_10300, partial [Polyangiaceae bacterium]|nr:hypothetical protein [Polyangiaceae bacterium]